MLRLYSVTLLVSAALLMLVQPLAAKQVLPLLGGTPEVWNTCMVFFQGALLLGYGYAHLATRWLSVRRQAIVHVALLAAQVAWLPLAFPTDAVAPGGIAPMFWLLGRLALAVGGPFVLAAATAPLLQRWFAASRHAAADDPYFLYVASNVGSMAALVGFPFVVEPLLTLRQQSWVWSSGFLLLVALIAACTVALWRRTSGEGAGGGTDRDGANVSAEKTRSAETAVATAADVTAPAVTWRERGGWLALSFVPSSWLLGVTNYLTTDIAPVPLLWLLPLAIYLGTFIVTFARRPRVSQRWLVRLFPVVLLLLVESILFTARWPVLLLHLAAFAWGALACHGELARRRPAAVHLTEFYWWLSLGGVLGGVFNGIVAPLVFPWLIEYPLAPALAAWLLARGEAAPSPAESPRDARRASRRESSPAADVADVADRRLRIVMLLVVLGVLALGSSSLASIERPVSLVVGVAVATVAGALLYLTNHPRCLALAVTVPLVMNQIAPPFAGEVLFRGRSYFGVHRVLAKKNEAGERYHDLVHGGTVHGRQARWAEREREPLTYYHRRGPLGQAFAELKWPERRRVGIVGLGSGATACYCEPHDSFTFFEIDPLVKQIAETPELFSYLSRGARGECRVEVGDGRQRLAACDDGSFDLIVLDAFSSDAVPVHLLTVEAIDIYVRKLAPDGVVLFHVSNRYLALDQVLAAVAERAGLACLVGRDDRISAEEFAAGRTPSTYVALARDARRLAPLADRAGWQSLASRGLPRAWTDDYSNVLSVLRWQ